MMTKEINQENEGDGSHGPQKPALGLTGRKIIYDKDGKPCRACNTLLDFKMATGAKPKVSGTFPGFSTAYAKDEPPDVEQLGRSTWTFLHSVAASYPEEASISQQEDMKSFLNIFGKIYPCWFCAKDFTKYIGENQPKVKTQEDFGRWLCDAHNSVNKKLGKPQFDCNLWKKRWKDGWDEEEN
ncbi:hypothetical protein PACTADRAFT_65210 [Pachysolen tannophilus NRRL Y-2460]|uniref:Sulfhydryl oxidase n=1 Tax=Pachysolen tannophilus NRRL Y-2460 TaxID=669874 RepID=A0A1E4TYA1_PACTA|nr:hypothetical protein PACTADRAFT_65210 [Pachysolen tannophilus NRRL Y-2460]